VTGRAFHRTRPGLFVATLAVHMQGIASRRVAFRAMAVLATAGHGAFLFFVVTTIARHAVPVFGGMGFVIQQDLARSASQHDSHGLFWHFGGKGSVTHDPYHEAYNQKTKRKQLFSLCCHPT